MLLMVAFFVAGFFVNPWPMGIAASIAFSAVLTFMIRNRYIETRRLAGEAAYLKVIMSAFAGSAVSFIALMYLGFFIGKFFGIDL